MPLFRPAATGRFKPELLFAPRSVAVAGAGTELGGTAMRNMLAAGFKGAVLPVGAGLDAVGGVLAYPDVAALPIVPDLGVIATAPEQAADAVAALGARGTLAAVCLTPAPGLRDAARAAGVRVLGPSSFGISVPGIGLNASTAHLRPRPGKLALVSQSAALCRAVLDWAEPNGVGFSHVVGIGGAADIGFGLVLDWLSRDGGTGAILLDIRTIRDRRGFLSAARAAARLRPVVAIHAGARQGDPDGRADQVFAAALRRAGIVRVDTLPDLLAAAETLTLAKPPRTDAIAIVTNAIGPGQLAADAATRLDLPLAQLSPATRKVLDLALPPGPSDPGVVWTGATNPIRLAETASMLSAAPEVGGVVVVMAPTGPADAAAIAALAAAGPGMKVSMLAAVLGEVTGDGHRRTLAAAGVPSFSSPENAIRGFAQLVEQRRARAAARELPPSTVLDILPDRGAVRDAFAAARAAGRDGLLQQEALAVLAAYGLPTVPSRPAATPEAAAVAAAELGFPAVVKLLRSVRPQARGPGGVMLDLRDGPAVQRAAMALADRRDGLPGDGLAGDGFLVQRQVGRSRELRIAVRDDTMFGPAIAFGQGGSAADLLGDTAMDLPPLNLTLASGLIARTRVAKTLADLHDQPAADRDGVADALVRVSQLIVDFPEIAALDINPLFASASGVLAGDAWISLRAGPPSVTAIAPYPAELAEHWMAGDQPVLIRPIRPEDAEAHAALFSRLTPEDIRYRFFSTLRALQPEQIARMTQVDYDREMAFVAVRESGEHAGETVGVARLVREPYTTTGEFAVVVEGSMKGKGLARRLMQRIMDWGASQGMTGITGQVLAENAPMLAFVRRLGFTVHRLPDEPDVVEAAITLPVGHA